MVTWTLVAVGDAVGLKTAGEVVARWGRAAARSS